MYIYLYDSFLEHKKYNKLIAKIETRITDLGLNGKIIRLNPLNSISSIIDSELKLGAKTIVGLGDNSTLSNIINSIANSEYAQINQSVTVGFIPIDNNNSIANCLGIDSINSACDILSNRRTKQINLGVVNDRHYFFTEAIIDNKNTIVEINENYTIETSNKGKTRVINIPLSPIPGDLGDASNKLKVFIEQNEGKFFSQKKDNTSLIYFDKLRIINEQIPLILDYSTEIKNPTDIKMSDKGIKLIIGKNRSFE